MAQGPYACANGSVDGYAVRAADVASDPTLLDREPERPAPAEWRSVPQSVFREHMDALRNKRAVLQRRLLLALQTMRKQAEVDASRVAAIGYCFGGLCVLDIARTGEALAGVVSFHGLFEPPGNTSGNRIQARILALHGWDDPLATPDQAVALAEELGSMGADWQLHGYGGVRHAFTNPAADASTGVTVYNADADRRSWAAAQYFLSELFDTRVSA